MRRHSLVEAWRTILAQLARNTESYEPHGLVGGSDVIVVLHRRGASAFSQGSSGTDFENYEIHGQGLIGTAISDDDRSRLNSVWTARNARAAAGVQECGQHEILATLLFGLRTRI